MAIYTAFILLYAVLALAQGNTGLIELLQSHKDLSTLHGAIRNVPGLADTLSGLSNITILAPTNNAFGAIPANITVASAIAANDTVVIRALLSYHVLQGNFTSDTITKTPNFVPTLLNHTAFSNVTGGQVVQAATSGNNVVFTTGGFTNSTVTQADIIVGGITVHKIDTVLSIPQNVSSTAAAAGLTSLAKSLSQAKLVDTVDSTPDLTIFAPNNAAFQALGPALANASIETLQQVLSYHVVKGSVAYSPDLTNTTVKTLEGSDIKVTVVDGTVFANSAKVVTPNVLVANGVVHVIDSVLNPNSTSGPSKSSPSAEPSAATSSSTPGAATSAVAVGMGSRAAATGMAGAIGAGALFAVSWVGF